MPTQGYYKERNMRSFKKNYFMWVLLLAAFFGCANAMAQTESRTNWYLYRNTIVALAPNGQVMCVEPAHTIRPGCLQTSGLSSDVLALNIGLASATNNVLVCNSASYQAIFGTVPAPANDSGHWCNAFKNDVRGLSPVMDSPTPISWYLYKGALVVLSADGEPACILAPPGNGIDCFQIDSPSLDQAKSLIADAVLAGNVLVCRSLPFAQVFGDVAPAGPNQFCDSFKSDIVTLNPL
jgi:hypothetical protein